MTKFDDIHFLRGLESQFVAMAERDSARNAVRAPSALRFATRSAIALVLATGGIIAVPGARATIGDAYATVEGWLTGDESSAPGHAVGTNETIPSWLDREPGEKRVLARAGGDTLVAVRHGDYLTLALDLYATGGKVADMRRVIAGQSIFLVGPGRFVANGRHDRRPLFGLLALGITRVGLRYVDGAETLSPGGLRGAFGFVIDTERQPRDLIGYDAGGQVVARLPLIRGETAGGGVADFRYCPGATGGCKPWPTDR